MPSFTFVRYEGSDDRILEFLSKWVGGTGTAVAQPADLSANGSSSAWDDIAKRFEHHVSATAATGRPGQKDALIAWLGARGKIQLAKLWRAAGVKNQHDYSGIGSSLTRNMKKAGGPRDWYRAHRNAAGEWIYEIVPELVEPLKRSFGV